MSFENKSINRVNIYIRRLVLNKNDIRNEYQFNWIYANEWKFKYNERKSIIFWNVDSEFILKKKSCIRVDSRNLFRISDGTLFGKLIRDRLAGSRPLSRQEIGPWNG